MVRIRPTYRRVCPGATWISGYDLRGTFMEFCTDVLDVSPVAMNCGKEERGASEIDDKVTFLLVILVIL